MGDDQRPTQRGHLSGELNLRSLLVIGWIMRRLNKAEKRRDPGGPGVFVGLNSRAHAVHVRALELAAERRDDPAAVAELRALAKGKKRTVRQAERATRIAGRARERRRENLAQRLLEAAIGDRPVAPIPQDALERVLLLEEFWALPPARRWTRLVSAQPALAELEAWAHASRRRPRRSVDPDSVMTDEDQAEQMEAARTRLELSNRLDSLVGPRAKSTDPFVSSTLARDVAFFHLMKVSDSSGSGDP